MRSAKVLTDSESGLVGKDARYTTIYNNNINIIDLYINNHHPWNAENLCHPRATQLEVFKFLMGTARRIKTKINLSI